jgi:hypothetical protein
MIQLGLFVGIGLGFLILLLLVMRRPATAAEGSAGALVAAKRTLQDLQTSLLPEDLIDRVFGKRDAEYVTSLGSKNVLDLFMVERKRLALAWVGQVREQLLSLKEFHTRRSRMLANMSRATEISIALNFVELQIQCRVLRLLLQWRGPYAAPQLVRKTASTAAGLCAVFDKSLAFLTPAFPAGMSDDSDANTAAV